MHDYIIEDLLYCDCVFFLGGVGGEGMVWEEVWPLGCKLCNNSFVSWVITRRELVWKRRFGTTYRSHFQESGCPRRSVTLEDGTDR